MARAIGLRYARFTMNELVRPRKSRTAAAAENPSSEASSGRTADSGRTNDPEATMANILEVATAEFADKGLAGARIDEIAALTRTSKRMIYYYFGSKEGLYIAVLEDAYRRIRTIEATLHLEDLEPEPALRKLVGFTFDYETANPDFIRLVMNENMHRAAFLAQSKTIQQLNVPVIHSVQSVYQRGVAAGVFRPDVDPVDLHRSISALCFFTVSNQHTFSFVFQKDLTSADAMAARRASIIEMIVRFVRQP